MPWEPTAAELETYALDNISYEVKQAILQGKHEMLTTPQASWTPTHDAMLHAVLNHLRLLDNFFRHDIDGDDVVARHYAPDWPLTELLTADQGRAISAQLSHLAARREPARYWDTADLLERLVDVYFAFKDQLSLDRQLWFQRATLHARRLRP